MLLRSCRALPSPLLQDQVAGSVGTDIEAHRDAALQLIALVNGIGGEFTLAHVEYLTRRGARTWLGAMPLGAAPALARAPGAAPDPELPGQHLERRPRNHATEQSTVALLEGRPERIGGRRRVGERNGNLRALPDVAHVGGAGHRKVADPGKAASHLVG